MADVRIKYQVDKGELVLARQELEKLKKEVGLVDKESKGLSTDMKVVGGAIAAAFTVDRLVDFGRQVVSITAEFQKLRAVLTNTLGSRSAADQAFKNIQTFAANTPFQVNQITDSFVRLANQGFVATNKQLTQLGDLAASTGKDFSQLTEAIIDAQVGEFERLKEFGIRASKEGDNVTFTFKGVETQVGFTQEAIRGYILSLGEATGVSGAMAAISETLGGRLSNLQDSTDALFFALGTKLNPAIGGTIEVLGAAVNAITDFINVPFVEQLRQQQVGLNVLVGAITDVNTSEEARARLIQQLNAEYPDFLKNLDAERVTNEQIRDRLEDVNDQFLRRIALAQAEERLAEIQDKILDTIDREAAAREEIQRLRQSDIALSGIRILGEEQKINQALEERAELQEEVTERLKIYTDSLDLFNSANSDYFETVEKANAVDKERIDTIELQRKGLKQLETGNEELSRTITNRVADTAKIEEERIRATEEIEAESINRRTAAYEAFYEVISTLGNELFLRQQIRFEEERAQLQAEQEDRITRLEEERDRRLELAGQSAEARKAIEQQFARDREAIELEIERKQKEIRQRSLKAEKAQAIFNTAINTAQGVVAALASVPPNVPLSIAIGVIGATQLAAIASRPIPKFAKGVLNLQGGTPGRDSVPSLLMPGESVMTTAETRDYMPTLKAIRENRIDPALLNAVAEGKGGGSRAEIHNNVIEVPRDNVVWDEDGFSLYMHRKSSTVQKKGIRYKC